MKSILIAGAIVTALSGAAFGQGYGANPSDHYVNGYTTSRGTEVQPHYQTNPNGSTYDNYETRGNYNPHTGAYGARSPYCLKTPSLPIDAKTTSRICRLPSGMCPAPSRMRWVSI